MELRTNLLRTTSISDIHLGHPSTPTVDILHNLDTYFMPKLAVTDFLVIDGDVFDSGLGLSDAPAQLILAFMIALLKECDRLGIVVRIVRGTVSHDRNQCATFATLHQQYGFTNSLRYFETISLEYIEELNLRMLYLPDDLPYQSSDAILAIVKAKMAELGWDTVDYACVHSYFEHHLPPGMPHKPKICYRAEQFDFVTRFVLCGHVHHGGQYQHVLTNGSTDRLAHGEEHDKGFFYIQDDGKDALIERVINHGAAIYATCDLTAHTETEAAVTAFFEWMQQFPTDRTINLRAMHSSAEVRTIIGRILLKEHPHVRYRQKIPNTGEESVAEPPQIDATHYTTPTPETLPQLVIEHLAKKERVHGLSLERVTAILDNL